MNIAKWIRWMILAAVPALVAAGCSKSDAKPYVVPPGYYDRQAYLLPLNTNFIVYDSVVKVLDLLDTLAQPGPYTTFIPDNNAMQQSGWGATTPNGIIGTLNLPPNSRSILLSLIFPGAHYLDSLPAVVDQKWISLSGTPAYVSKYMSTADTVYAINGLQVTTTDFPSSNGPIEIIDARIPPIQAYQTITAYVNSEPELSYLSVALSRCGLSTILSDTTKTFTFLAPVNGAFQQSSDPSINTLDSLRTADTAKLANLLRFHIIQGRSFLFDFDQQNPGNGDTLKVNTLYNGEQLAVLFQDQYGNPGNFFYGYGDAGNPVSLGAMDQPIGNGVVHEVSGFVLP